MKNVRYLLLLMLCTFICSCNPSQGPISDLRDLVEEVESGEDFTESEWNEIAAEYDEIESALCKYEYSDEELKEIGKLKGKLGAEMTKGMVDQLQEGFEAASKELEGAIEGWLEGFSEE